MTTATATETQTRQRNENVSDETVLNAWQSVATSGKPDACIDMAAEVAGMKKSSFQQRISKMRTAIAAAHEAALEDYEAALAEAEENGTEAPEAPVLFELAEMPRKSGGGRKATPKDFMSLLGRVNGDLGIETPAVDADTDSDDEGESDEG